MDTLQEIDKQYFRTDLPELEVGDKIEVVTKNLSKNEKGKHLLTRFKGTVIARKNPQQISYTFSVLKESGKVAVKSVFSYHSPLIVNIKKFGKINQKVRQAKLNNLARELAAKKDNE